MNEVIFTQEELEECCKMWQKILRLEHCDIKISISRAYDFTEEGNEGEIDYTLEKSDAAIRILDNTDYPESCFHQDMEQTLVHELLHIYFAAFRPEQDENSLEHKYWERTIDDLAKILVKLRRERDDKDNEMPEEILIDFIPEPAKSKKTKKK